MQKDPNSTYIIAELSANHNNDFELAVKTVEAIAKTGANAIKVQTYQPQSLSLPLDSGVFAPRQSGLWKGYTPWELYQHASMPYAWQPKLKAVAEAAGLEFFSSPFDAEGVDFLAGMGVPRYKIASFEITDTPLIAYAASQMKPMIISTGVAKLSDIERAIEACRSVGNDDITILKCTSEYPATFADANLATIPNMRDTFGVKVGVSDHTMGSTVPVVAVTMGARVVEKHVTLDRAQGGPDSTFSMEPQEFTEMVARVREAEQAIGQVTYAVSEQNKLRRRSLFAVADIQAGQVITADMVRSIRPGHGAHPRHLSKIIGSVAHRDYRKGDPFVYE